LSWAMELAWKINTHPNTVVSVYICRARILGFFDRVLPFVFKKVVLVTGDSDLAVNDDFTFGNPLDHPKVTAIYAQNLDMVHPSAHPFPIGLDYHTVHSEPHGRWGHERMTPQEQEDMLWSIREAAPPWAGRRHGAFASFSPGTNRDARTKCLARLERLSSTLVMNVPVSREVVWNQMANHQFVASPLGNGLDCHRTWEALALGTVPIVNRKPAMSPLFEDLPVWEVEDYIEVTPDSLREMESTIAKGLAENRYNFEKLTVDWWRKRIAETVEEVRSCSDR